MASYGICFGCEIEFLSDNEIISEDRHNNQYCAGCTDEVWQNFERQREAKRRSKIPKSKPAVCWR